jgi:AMP-activated protein kinase-like protein
VLLQPGHYEYRFVVDGQWQDDPMASRFAANSFGGLNCVVDVKPIAMATTPVATQP